MIAIGGGGTVVVMLRSLCVMTAAETRTSPVMTMMPARVSHRTCAGSLRRALEMSVPMMSPKKAAGWDRSVSGTYTRMVRASIGSATLRLRREAVSRYYWLISDAMVAAAPHPEKLESMI